MAALGMDDLVELRKLVRDSDSIELKLTVPQKSHRAASCAPTRASSSRWTRLQVTTCAPSR